MKKIKFLALAALTVLAFACAKEEQTVKDVITLSSSDITVGKKACTAKISFNANNAWTASNKGSEWISLDVTSGNAGDVTLTASFKDNKSYDVRNGEIEIVCGTAKATVKVTQNLNDVIAVVMYENVDYNANEIRVAVVTNVDYDVRIDCGGLDKWIELDDTKAEPTQNALHFIVDANTRPYPRSADIYITSVNKDNDLMLVVKQDCKTNSTAGETVYFSNGQKPYDTGVWAPTTFAQFGIALARYDKTGAALVLNVNKADVDTSDLKFPVGEFVCDADASHAAGTFSIKPADGSENYYTCMTDSTGSFKSEVLDGTVSISVVEGNYVIKANLMDEEGNFELYSYEGPIDEIENRSIGAQMFTDFYADYNTHFSEAVANQWNVECYISEAVPGVDELVYKLGFTLFGNGGEATLDQIPAGEYTYATPGTVAGYPKGNWDAAAFTFESSKMCGYSDYDPVESTYRYVDILDGKITIANVNTEEHTFDIAYDLDIKTYAYNWDTWEEEDVKTYDYKYSFERVKYIPKDSGMRPILDEDQELTGCMISSQFTSYWYGSERFGVKGTNIFWFGFMNVNNEFTMTLPLSTDGEWTWVADIRDLYCSTPLPDGKYEYSATPVANCLCNIGTPASRRGLISNGYTGSTAYVDGGSIEFTDGNTHIAIDLNATITYADQTTKAVHYTGGFDCSLSMHRNNSTKSITWATTE